MMVTYESSKKTKRNNRKIYGVDRSGSSGICTVCTSIISMDTNHLGELSSYNCDVRYGTDYETEGFCSGF